MHLDVSLFHFFSFSSSLGLFSLPCDVHHLLITDRFTSSLTFFLVRFAVSVLLIIFPLQFSLVYIFIHGKPPFVVDYNCEPHEPPYTFRHQCIAKKFRAHCIWIVTKVILPKYNQAKTKQNKTNSITNTDNEFVWNER